MGWVVVLLLVVVAVLLFGRGAVLGVAGAALGQLGGVVLLAVIIIGLLWAGINPFIALIVFFAVIGLIIGGLKIWMAIDARGGHPVIGDGPAPTVQLDPQGVHSATLVPPNAPPRQPRPAILYPEEAGHISRPEERPVSFFAPLHVVQQTQRRIKGVPERTEPPKPVAPKPAATPPPSQPAPKPPAPPPPAPPAPKPAASKHRPPPPPQVLVDAVEPPDDEDDDERAIVMDGLRKRMELAYVDAAGAATDRIVQVRRITLFRRTPYIEGVCELRHEWRRFRVSRCREIIDLDTGEVRTGADLVDDIASEWDGPIKP